MAKKQKKLDDISKKFGDEREKALNDALKLIEKDFGKGSIMRLGERAEQKVQVMSSGSLALDIALGLISTNFSCLNQTQGNKDLKLLVN